MAITLFTVSLTLNFVNQSLARHNGENDLTLAKTFMENVGFGIDDVAWRTGQMDTLRYSSQSAEMYLRDDLFNYTITITHTNNVVEHPVHFSSSVLFYNIPLSKYYLDNTYFEPLLPKSMNNIVQNTTTSPIAYVFAVQKNPIIGVSGHGVAENEYIRVGVAPLLRSVAFNITTNGITSRYIKLYIINATKGPLTTVNPQYITLKGMKVSANMFSKIKSIDVTLQFPRAIDGYDYAFFGFDKPPLNSLTHYRLQPDDIWAYQVEQSLPKALFGSDGANVEIYVGKVDIGFLS